MPNVLTRTKLLFALASMVVLLSGCATAMFQPNPQINTVVLANNSNTTVYDVTILVEAFGGKFYCGTILEGTQCSTRFPVREYESNPITVSWVEDGEAHKTEPFTIPVNDNLAKNLAKEPLTARLTILQNNTVDARLEAR